METSIDIGDLRGVDRDVMRAWGAWEKWRSDVAREPDAFADHEAIAPYRHVAGQRAYERLAAITPSALDAPLIDGLRRWVAALTTARLEREVDAEWAKEASEASGRLDLGKVRLVSYGEAWRGLLAAQPRAERMAWLTAAAERGPAIASILARRAAIRVEVAHRLGLGDSNLDDAASNAARPTMATPAALSAAAERLLASTDDIARTCLREARARADLAAEAIDPSDAIAVALGRDAPEGWPARLTARWLDETFGTLVRGLRIALPSLPSALGAASFARALRAFGHAFRVAGASPSLPFAIARDPQFTAAHRFANVFGALPSSSPFQARILGNSARVASSQARVLARTALMEARLAAVRYILTASPHAARERFEELTTRLLGAPMPRAHAGAWPAPRDDEPARLLALLTTLPLIRDLVDRFDADWFANPRIPMHLRALASAPARELDPPGDLDLAARTLARSFEEALG